MDIGKILPGPKGKVPSVVYVFVEIPKGSKIKYEFDKEANILVADRMLHTSYVYPGDYGFIPQCIGEDKDFLDCLVLVNEPGYPGTLISARPIAIMRMVDEGGRDDKIIAVPADDVDPRFKDIRDLQDLPKHYVKELKHFFEHMKELEPGKWARIEKFEDAEAAKKAIKIGIALYKENK